jgi:galactosylceramide sulfotransferase
MVTKKIEEIENNFDLLMIVEKFEESLILMKDELCWDTSDITSLKLNGRIEDVKIKLNDSTRSLLKDYLKSDYLLYNYFLTIIKNKIEQFGKRRMEDELSALSAANFEISQQCLHSPSDKLVGDPRKSWGGKGLLGYDAGNKTNEKCTRMVERERNYVGRLQNIQKEKLISDDLD